MSAICNEAPFLLEWVAYHRLIGFTDIVLYSNNCTDRTPELCEELHRIGVVHHVALPSDRKPPQWHTLRHFRNSGFARPGDWVMCADTDEYLSVKVGLRRLDDLISEVGGASGVLIGWRLFGDGGRNIYSGRSISEAYVTCASISHPQCQTVKTLFRFGADVADLGVHVPKMTEEFWERGAPFLSPRLQTIDRTLPSYDKWRGTGVTFVSALADVSHDFVQLNHHFSRSPACYQIKRLRGGGASLERRDDGIDARYSLDQYEHYNANTDIDRSHLWVEPELDQMLSDLLAVPGIAALQEETYRDFRRFEALYLSQIARSD